MSDIELEEVLYQDWNLNEQIFDKSGEANEFKLPRNEIIYKKNIIFNNKVAYEGNKSAVNKYLK